MIYSKNTYWRPAMNTNPLTEQDIDNVLAGIRDRRDELKFVSGYKFTRTDGRTSFAMEIEGLGSVLLNRDDEGIYHFSKLEILCNELEMIPTTLYISLNALVRDHARKEWLIPIS